MSKSNYTIEELKLAVLESSTYQQVQEKLGLDSNYLSPSVWKKIKLYGIPTSHFPGRGVHGYALKEILIEDSPFSKTGHLREKLYNAGMKIAQCEECGLLEWRGKKINFHLHHRNGIHHDNRIENLQILCPLCHSQTENYGHKNKGKGRKRR